MERCNQFINDKRDRYQIQRSSYTRMNCSLIIIKYEVFEHNNFIQVETFFQLAHTNSIYFIFTVYLRNMGNICTSKHSNNLAAGAKVPTGSQYNLDGTTTNPEELKYFTAGKQYENSGEYNKAHQLFNLAIQANPYSSMSYVGIGNCFTKQNDNARAIENYTRAASIDPNNKFAYNGLGAIYSRYDPNQATINFNKALQLDPNFAYPYNGLGTMFYEQKKYSQATQQFQRAASLSTNPIIQVNLASCYMRTGNNQKAIQILKNAIGSAHSQGFSQANKYSFQQRLQQFGNAAQGSQDQRYVNQINQLIGQNV